MRKLFRCLLAILLLIAGIAFSGGPAAAPLEAFEEDSCGDTLQTKGRSFDAGQLTCTGSGSDCPGALPN